MAEEDEKSPKGTAEPNEPVVSRGPDADGPQTGESSPKFLAPADPQPVRDVSEDVPGLTPPPPSELHDLQVADELKPIIETVEVGPTQAAATNPDMSPFLKGPDGLDEEDDDAGSMSASQIPEAVKHEVNKWLEYRDETEPCHKLRSLCKKGDIEGLRQFLATPEPGLDVNTVSDEGWTCLHEIITHECQFTDVARVLLGFGAAVNTQDLHGDSPLHSALLYHNTDNIGLLVEHGANLSLLNGSGRMPIHVADEVETLKLLLDQGAPVNAQDQVGNTPLHYAVVARDRERVALMLNHYAPNANLQNQAGSTALHLTSDTDIAQMLLMAGAEPTIPDLNRNTPLHVAVRGRHKEMVKMMIEKGADVSLVNTNGKTPMNLAKDREMRHILQGKISATPNQLSSMPCATNHKKTAPTGTEKSGAKSSSSVSESIEKLKEQTIIPPCVGPGILKRPYPTDPTDQGAAQPPRPKGPRLRFSEVNDYSGVEVVEAQKRVKVPPIYSEPKFSSDDEF